MNSAQNHSVAFAAASSVLLLLALHGYTDCYSPSLFAALGSIRFAIKAGAGGS